MNYVAEILDDVYGPENRIATVSIVKTSGATSDFLPSTTDYLLWYCRDRERAKFRPVFL